MDSIGTKSELDRIIRIIRYSNSWDRIVLFVFSIQSICNFRIIFKYPNSCHQIPNIFFCPNLEMQLHLKNLELFGIWWKLFGYSNIIWKSQMDRIPNTNNTIRSQLFEYRIIRIIRSNSAVLCCWHQFPIPPCSWLQFLMRL